MSIFRSVILPLAIKITSLSAGNRMGIVLHYLKYFALTERYIPFTNSCWHYIYPVAVAAPAKVYILLIQVTLLSRFQESFDSEGVYIGLRKLLKDAIHSTMECSQPTKAGNRFLSRMTNPPLIRRDSTQIIWSKSKQNAPAAQHVALWPKAGNWQVTLFLSCLSCK